MNCMVANDVRGYSFVKAKAAVGDGRRLAFTGGLAPNSHWDTKLSGPPLPPSTQPLSGQPDQLEGPALPTLNSKEPLLSCPYL
jgi:hypothetical protein